MAGKVFFSVSMSLDGFVAPGSLGELMGQQWMELQAWKFPLRFFRENLAKLGEGGEEGRDNDIERETFERTGSVTPGSGRAARRSTSSTTASSPRSIRPAMPPTTGTSASRAAARRSWSTSTPA
jgi:hypothetical protein